MLTIPFNGEPCLNCGQRVEILIVNAFFTRRGQRYRANVTKPCGCAHSVEHLFTTVDPDDLIAQEVVG